MKEWEEIRRYKSQGWKKGDASTAFPTQEEIKGEKEYWEDICHQLNELKSNKAGRGRNEPKLATKEAEKKHGETIIEIDDGADEDQQHTSQKDIKERKKRSRARRKKPQRKRPDRRLLQERRRHTHRPLRNSCRSGLKVATPDS